MPRPRGSRKRRSDISGRARQCAGAHAEAIKPHIDCLPPAQTLGYLADGELLFQLLFGSDPVAYTQLFVLAFASGRPSRATRCRASGWTVEFQPRFAPAAFPEYVEHVCHFPARLLLDALLGDPQALTGMTYFFPVLGWQAGTEQENADDQRLLRAIADWCRTRLAEELAAKRWQGEVCILLIVALERVFPRP